MLPHTPSVRHQVTTAEAGTMCGLYVVYVLVTFYTSRTLEPLHADVALREMPPDDGGVGEQGQAGRRAVCWGLRGAMASTQRVPAQASRTRTLTALLARATA
jgi:hypothetical protein